MANRIDVEKGKSMALALKACGAIILVSASTIMYAGPFESKRIDFEMTGTVYDADTKEPIEGAFVLASYKVFRGDLAASGSFCVKTKGMYTAKDGRYHFPVEKLDGRSPFSTSAIKPGYFLEDFVLPEPKIWKAQNAAAYSGRDIFLKKQDPVKPKWRFSTAGDEMCTEAVTREAAAAGVTFLKLTLGEYDRYNASEQGRRAVRERINHYESLPAEPATSRK